MSVSGRSKLVERLLDATASLPVFMKDLLQTMAVTVAGTEAVGFILDRDEGNPTGLRPITHIRPDEADDELRASAIKAFVEIIVPCVQQNQDAAIEVDSPDEGESQFCLVTLLRLEGRAVAVAAIIARCSDQERAEERLATTQMVAGYFELYMIRRAVLLQGLSSSTARPELGGCAVKDARAPHLSSVKRASRILLHMLFILSLVAMVGPQVWKLVENDDDPRTTVAGWFFVIHKDNEIVIRTPSNVMVSFSYYLVCLFCVCYIVVWIAWLVRRISVQRSVATRNSVPINHTL